MQLRVADSPSHARQCATPSWFHGATLDDGRVISRRLVHDLLDDEMDTIAELVGTERFASGRFKDARELFVQVALEDDFVEFLTLPVQRLID